MMMMMDFGQYAYMICMWRKGIHPNPIADKISELFLISRSILNQPYILVVAYHDLPLAL